MANLTSNTASLQEILAKVNALPEAGGGGSSGGGNTGASTVIMTVEFDNFHIIFNDGTGWAHDYSMAIFGEEYTIANGSVIVISAYSEGDVYADVTGGVNTLTLEPTYAFVVNGPGSLHLYEEFSIGGGDGVGG